MSAAYSHLSIRSKYPGHFRGASGCSAIPPCSVCMLVAVTCPIGTEDMNCANQTSKIAKTGTSQVEVVVLLSPFFEATPIGNAVRLLRR